MCWNWVKKLTKLRQSGGFYSCRNLLSKFVSKSFYLNQILWKGFFMCNLSHISMHHVYAWSQNLLKYVDSDRYTSEICNRSTLMGWCVSEPLFSTSLICKLLNCFGYKCLLNVNVHILQRTEAQISEEIHDCWFKCFCSLSLPSLF